MAYWTVDVLAGWSVATTVDSKAVEKAVQKGERMVADWVVRMGASQAGQKADQSDV